MRVITLSTELLISYNAKILIKIRETKVLLKMMSVFSWKSLSCPLTPEFEKFHR